jgi:hypothetical protein
LAAADDMAMARAMAKASSPRIIGFPS